MALTFLFLIALCIITFSTTILSLPPTEPPLIPDHPFVAIWNAPISKCQKHEIPLDLAAFLAVTTTALVPDQFLILFYEDRLGLYPKVDVRTQKSYRGGIPQNGSLTAHLDKAGWQINQYMSPDTPGLTVIDWESWRPLWDRNWGSKRIYQRLSIKHAQKMSPLLSSKTQIEKLARTQFEREGRRFMESTISLGIDKRPSRRWGFYLFPDCYNHGWENSGYTGKCSPKTQEQNNQLLWLWERSTALFPSVYISEGLRNSPHAKLYVRNRVQEAMRVASLPKRSYTAPTYVYSRILYRTKRGKFLSKVRQFDELKSVVH